MRALCEEIWQRGLAGSKGQAKRLILQGAFLVNLKVPTDPYLEVSGGDKITRKSVMERPKTGRWEPIIDVSLEEATPEDAKVALRKLGFEL